MIDAKFPLEASPRIATPSDEQRRTPRRGVRQDIARHVNDIAEKYSSRARPRTWR